MTRVITLVESGEANFRKAAETCDMFLKVIWNEE